MKRFMTTTATLVVLASGAHAQETADAAFIQYDADPATQLYASDLLGSRIYATEAEIGDTVAEGAEAEWDDLGEINDMILSEDGSVEVVLLGVGGFLGIGEREVAVAMDQLRIVRDGANPTDYLLVINATRESVENAPEFTRPEVEVDPAMQDGATVGAGGGLATDPTMTGGGTATDPATTQGIESEEPAAGMEEGAGQPVEDAAQATGNAAEDAAQATGNALESAGDAIQSTAEEAEQEIEGEIRQSN